MDDRWRFLYCVRPELWGRMCKPWPGREKTGTSGAAGRKEKPPPKGETVMWTETRVGKHGEHVPGKAAIAAHTPVP